MVSRVVLTNVYLCVSKRYFEHLAEVGISWRGSLCILADTHTE